MLTALEVFNSTITKRDDDRFCLNLLKGDFVLVDNQLNVSKKNVFWLNAVSRINYSCVSRDKPEIEKEKKTKKNVGKGDILVYYIYTHTTTRRPRKGLSG